MIVAGLAPATMGDLADKVGRRIVYLVIITIYCTANIGLALQSNWTALFILRMLQSAGSAGITFFFALLKHLLRELTHRIQRPLPLDMVLCQILLPPPSAVYISRVWCLGKQLSLFQAFHGCSTSCLNNNFYPIATF